MKLTAIKPTVLVTALRLGLGLAALELVAWLLIVYPPLVASCLLALPLATLLPLWWKLPQYPVFLTRLSILWLAILLGYSMMEIISHPVARPLAITQGLLDMLLYFISIGVIRAFTTPPQTTSVIQ